MKRTMLSLSLAALLAAGCSSDTPTEQPPPPVVTDSLGLRFAVDCSWGICFLTPQNANIAPLSCASGNGTDVFVLAIDPILAIVALRVPSSGQIQMNAADPSHPVVCATDADCLAPGITIGAISSSYTCRSGLCQLATTCANGSCTPWDGVLLTYDVLTLCQADIPWPTTCPYITSLPFANRIAEVGAACGAHTTCATVPADCRQPNGPVGPVGIDGGTVGIDGGVVAIDGGP